MLCTGDFICGRTKISRLASADLSPKNESAQAAGKLSQAARRLERERAQAAGAEWPVLQSNFTNRKLKSPVPISALRPLSQESLLQADEFPMDRRGDVASLPAATPPATKKDSVVATELAPEGSWEPCQKPICSVRVEISEPVAKSSSSESCGPSISVAVG